MFKFASERKKIKASNLRGGVGEAIREDVFSPEESLGKFELCVVMTIPHGTSIGEHPHGPDGELYFVLSGTLRITDNGTTKDLQPGDAVFTGGGNAHSVVNVSGKDATMLALVVH